MKVKTCVNSSKDPLSSSGLVTNTSSTNLARIVSTLGVRGTFTNRFLRVTFTKSLSKACFMVSGKLRSILNFDSGFSLRSVHLSRGFLIPRFLQAFFAPTICFSSSSLIARFGGVSASTKSSVTHLRGVGMLKMGLEI